MALFDRLFGNGKTTKQPEIRFGRYSDVYHNDGQDEAFDQAVQSFEKEDFQGAYKSFFQYLKNDVEDNIKVWEEGDTVKFELFQGSKKVVGYGNNAKLHAETKIAKINALQTGFMRRLLEKNYELKYSRFTITPENEISIIFDTYTIDGSPFKLYAALKELATHADKLDDLLLDEFEVLEPLGLHIRRVLPDWEKELKYNYITQEINAAFHEIDHGKLDSQQYPISTTYLLLYLCYKLDYLTKPEGFMMESLERTHRLAFEPDGKNVVQKNQLLRKEFQKLLNRSKDKYFKEMYEVRATFGITAPIDHQKVAHVIDQELPNMQWYLENGHEKIALSIPGFIAGRCLFYFAVPKPDREYFHLLMQVLEADYFEKLGFQSLCPAGKPDEKRIKKTIRAIAEANQEKYPLLHPDLKLLNFKSLPLFAQSFCTMVRELGY